MTRLAAVVLACVFVLALGALGPGTARLTGASAEVVVALAGPSLAEAPGRRAELDAEQRAFRTELAARLPDAHLRWRYRLVLNGFAVSVPESRIPDLRGVPGVRDVFESARYVPQLDRSPNQIGARALWGANLSTAGQGIKVGIIDTGIDAAHPFFDPSGYTMPTGFPKGQARFTSAKVIVARAFPPAGAKASGAAAAFDGDESSHGTHVAGIAAGNANTTVSGGRTVSGVAPRAYLGNYKALVRTDSGLSPNGNAPEIVAAIEAAVVDGMDVINLSIGEPEIEPSRDVVALALDAAAKAGVVSTVAAGNDYNELGAGSISSPANSAEAIAVAAVEMNPPTHADFSSVGPTPISYQLKPDVSAPGVGILSSVPGGGWSSLSGTSMAAPHIAGAAALLLQRHPTWTIDEIRSALIQSGNEVSPAGGDSTIGPQFQGGGVVALTKADQPLLFAEPSSISIGLLDGRPVTQSERLRLRDAGGGAGTWNATVQTYQRVPGASLTLDAQEVTVTVPGELPFKVRVGASAQTGDLSGYIVLRRLSEVRKIPFWARVAVPRLGKHRVLSLQRPGVYQGTTAGRPALVSRYRYPENPSGVGVTTVLRGREAVYRILLRRRVANFGVVVTQAARGVRVEPRVVSGQDENQLTGYAGLPVARNPYLEDAFWTPVPAAGALSPEHGTYSIVFDSATKSGAGRFTFRYWVNDVTPPTMRLRSASVQRGASLMIAATDAGSGVSPEHVFATIDGRAVRATFGRGVVRIGTAGLSPGTHRLRLQVSDYQETKNDENVARILPNTRVLTTTFRVR